MFPPLLRPSSPVSDHSVHPFDRFFLLPSVGMHVLGSMQLGQAKVYVVEHRAEPQEPWFGAGKEGAMCSRVTRAFIDPAQGYLPLRVEAGYVRIDHGRLVDDQPQLDNIVECLGIQRLPGAGFYPTKGVNRSLVLDPKDPSFDATLTAETYINAPLRKLVVVADKRWDVTRVTTDEPVSRELFALEFPNGTRYSDMVTGVEHLAGTPDEAFQEMLNGRKPQEESSSPRPRWWRRGGMKRGQGKRRDKPAWD